MAEEALEVDKNGAERVLSKKRPAYVLGDSYRDLDFIREAFSLGKLDVELVDMNDFYPAIMNYGDDSELKAMAKKYDGALIVCPHGISSKAFAEALRALGANAYSLKGGIEGLREGKTETP